ncbi:hypothetical protein KSS87_012589 [Heliosperma pusillum]|nr:hypothetical protein KSS87_012589 [Heliosperma pusillum]
MEETPNRELYALLNISPEASTEEIRKAYRQWAQIYHPDKYQASNMKEIATENFQRICEAYEILSDESKRQIYDIYGMEGLKSGLELGVKLNKAEEIKEELERLRRRKEFEKLAQVRSSGSIMANLSLPNFLDGDGFMRGMSMATEAQSQLSKGVNIALGGNLAVIGNSGGGNATAVLSHQISPVASIEYMASAGLRSLIGLAMSLKDGVFNLSNSWTRQLTETSNGNIQFQLGTDSSIAVGWQKKEEKRFATGEIKFGTSSFEASANYKHRFSLKSHGRIRGRIGSNALEFEIGGGRRISKFSTVQMLYSIGIQGIFWKFELHRGGQKLIVPVLLSSYFNPVFAAGAFAIPTSLYFVLKKFVAKPYYLRREKQKALENMEQTSGQVREARIAAAKAQQLLEVVAGRKRNKQMEVGGLVITKAFYGSEKAVNKQADSEESSDDLASQVIDVTIPLNFLVNDLGQLKLHEGVKKSGIMGFCDPCPSEPKKLLIEYTCGDRNYKVVVDDCELLLIPQEAHRV